MYLGMITISLGIIWYPLGQIVAWLTLPLAKLWIEIVLFAGGLSGGIISLEVNWWWAAGWWLLWTSLIVLLLKHRAVV